jgi:hypothetical protein
MGMESRVVNDAASYAVGDLLTVIATYDSTLRLSSNGLAGDIPSSLLPSSTLGTNHPSSFTTTLQCSSSAYMGTLAGAAALSAAVKGPWLSDPSTQDDLGGRHDTLHHPICFELH